MLFYSLLDNVICIEISRTCIFIETYIWINELYLSLLEKVWRMVYGKIRIGDYVVVAVVGGDGEILKLLVEGFSFISTLISGASSLLSDSGPLIL